MVSPYLDTAKSENKREFEFSLHGLSWNHLIVIFQAMKQFSKLADEDFDSLASKLTNLTECEMELLVDAAAYRKVSNDLVKILKDLE